MDCMPMVMILTAMVGHPSWLGIQDIIRLENSRFQQYMAVNMAIERMWFDDDLNVMLRFMA